MAPGAEIQEARAMRLIGADTVPANTAAFDFRLTGHGWAVLDVQIGDKSLSIDSFGDCSHAFLDFLMAAISAADGQGYFEFVLNGEPAGWRWRLASRYDDRVGYHTHLIVDLFRDAFQLADQQPVATLLEAYVDADVLARAIGDGVEAAFADTQAGDELWGHPFPSRAQAALKAALATARTPIAAFDFSQPYGQLTAKPP
tara:strand:- start:188 stop:787 length:600 start_codon:yes stop_codon:yes gene_type:complete